MKRILIKDLPQKIGQKVTIAGWVNSRRDHGKIIFMDIRDRSGLIQTVVIPDQEEAYEKAKKIKNEFVVEIEGKVKERPGETTNKAQVSNVEIEIENLKIISSTKEELPVEITKENINLNLETLLNHRSLILRNEKIKSIFKIYATLLDAYNFIMRQNDFLEIKTPKILSNATEGGANFFKIKYFDRDAFLAQSPQFYKQAGVSVFERVFEIGSVFRAEPHFTTRHLNEYVSLDAEMGFIEGFEDIMDQLEKVITFIIKEINKQHKKEINQYNIDSVSIPKKGIPRLRLDEAREILKKEMGKEIEKADIDPEGERLIGEYAKKEWESDFVFLTHYPVTVRPFYTMPDFQNKKLTFSFDLIFRGVEIATGGQRIHDYYQLIDNMKKHKLDPNDYKHYLDIFRYGMPPHGGWGMGSERIVQKILGLNSIKEAVLFPRDVKRLTP